MSYDKLKAFLWKKCVLFHWFYFLLNLLDLININAIHEFMWMVSDEEDLPLECKLIVQLTKQCNTTEYPVFRWFLTSHWEKRYEITWMTRFGSYTLSTRCFINRSIIHNLIFILLLHFTPFTWLQQNNWQRIIQFAWQSFINCHAISIPTCAFHE